MITGYDFIAELAKGHKPEVVRALIHERAPSLTCAQLGVALGDPYRPIPTGKATDRLEDAIAGGTLYTTSPKSTRRDRLLANVQRFAFAQWLEAFDKPADLHSEAAFWVQQP